MPSIPREDKTLSKVQLSCSVPQNTEEGVVVAKGLSQLQFYAIRCLNNNLENVGCMSSLDPVSRT